jgi:hypothetical protein
MALEIELHEGRSWGIWGGVSARDRQDGLRRVHAPESGDEVVVRVLADELLNEGATARCSPDRPVRQPEPSHARPVA